MGPKKKETKKEKELKEKEKELKEKENELKEKEKGLKEPCSPKKLTSVEKEKLIKKIKEKYKNEKFYCVAERKKNVCVECIIEVDISRNPYRIIGKCKECKKPISKFISAQL